MSKQFFSRKYSKIFVISSILKSINESQSGNDKLIIHTANGLYIGDFKEFSKPSDLKIEGNDDILTCYNKLYLSTMESYKKNDDFKDDIEVSENPISITLENVKLITSSNTINMPFVILFVDQIIGFSVGHM